MGLKILFCSLYKTGYLIKLKFYDGNKSSLKNTVLKLLEGREKKFHEVYMDNFYNSYGISTNLFELGFYIPRTLRNKRGGPIIQNKINKKSIPQKSALPLLKEMLNLFIFNDRKIFTIVSINQHISENEILKKSQHNINRIQYEIF